MTTRAHKTSKMFEQTCRPQFVIEKYVAMLTRSGLRSRKDALQFIADIRAGREPQPMGGKL